MKQRIAAIINIAAGVVLGVFIAGQFGFTNDESGFINNLTGKNDRIAERYYAPPHPTELSFAGEKVPLERWDVKERFDRELLFNYYNQANILYLLKLANRYFPTISERLQANGVPDDFKYLCVAESNLLSGARSGVGASGYWQFMPGTAPGYGLTVNDQVDFRSDLIKSTDAACQYLKAAYQKFGSWTAAAASYNMGQGGYNGQASFQGTKHYYDLQLPEETNRYLFRILAFKHLMSNPEASGFVLKDEEKYQVIPTQSIVVNTNIPNLAQWAQARGTTYKMIRQLNPWLRGRSLNTGGRSYEIKIPAQ
ncbi:MAG TPA: lytic transglycosylase domain-containing protein [Flavisolibacter sp.]|nr:lytic transglycosylase domain-containing protein [Flavisolibacter sp.]